MKKIIRIVLSVLGWTIISIMCGLVTIAFMIGCAEGDLSHGIMYYLN